MDLPHQLPIAIRILRDGLLCANRGIQHPLCTRGNEEAGVHHIRGRTHREPTQLVSIFGLLPSKLDDV